MVLAPTDYQFPRLNLPAIELNSINIIHLDGLIQITSVQTKLPVCSRRQALMKNAAILISSSEHVPQAPRVIIAASGTPAPLAIRAQFLFSRMTAYLHICSSVA
jgi:hypothetical protein